VISEFEASLVYRVSSRTARATQGNPVSKQQQQQQQEQQQQQQKTNKKKLGAGEMAQQLRALAAIVEDQGLVPRIYIILLNL
jgi:Na+/citrate or Na+/malate symporter